MTEFITFLLSIGGLIGTIALALLWLRVRARSAWPRRFLIAVLLCYTMATIYPISFNAGQLLISDLRPLVASDVPAGRTAIVVLGSGGFNAHDWDGNARAIPDPAGANRVMEAVRAYRLLNPDRVISSGGRPHLDDTTPPSGEIMRDMLVELGVPGSKILVETRSRNTHDEAVIVADMLNATPVDHVVLVTSDLHMRRSLGAFRAAGIEAIPAIARQPHYRTPWNVQWLPSDAGMSEAGSVVHEVLGIVYYAARGWYK